MSSVLAKDIEKFKADLHAAAVEHQVRFSKLHQKRVEVLAQLYKLLVEANWQAATFVSPMQWAGDPNKKTQYATAVKAIAEYFRFFDKHRIWRPARLCDPLEAFAKQLRSPTIHLGVYVGIEHPTENTLKERGEVWAKAWESVERDIPKLRTAIEAEFRELLSVGDAKAG
jgi:hypothetical protein